MRKTEISVIFEEMVSKLTELKQKQQNKMQKTELHYLQTDLSSFSYDKLDCSKKYNKDFTFTRWELCKIASCDLSLVS